MVVRSLWVLGCCWALGTALAPRLRAAASGEFPAILENGAGRFKVEISGCPVSSDNVLSVQIDDLVIDPVEIPDADSEVRVYVPGKPRFGQVRIRVGVPANGPGNELFDWWLAASRARDGKDVRKSISVTCLNRDGTPARRFNLVDCFPQRWDPGDYSPTAGVATEIITCKMGRVELARLAGGGGGQGQPPPRSGNGPRPPGFANLLPVSGFAVEIAGGGAAQPESDAAWETCVGGGLNIELPDADGDASRPTSPGHKYVDTITLRGPMTAGRSAWCDWINEVAGAQPGRRALTLRELNRERRPGRSFVYHDAFPTRYVFPSFSVTGTGNLYEEVSIKPIRLELK